DQPERLDVETLEFDDYRDCMRDLATVNVVTLAARPTLAFLDTVRRRGLWPRERPLRIVDGGSGYGEQHRSVERWTRRHGLRAELVGIDLNPDAARIARRNDSGVEWVTSDVFAYSPPGGVDIIMSSLFAHHLDDGGVAHFLGWMERTARVGWF